jgi:tetratricopeptide (TPR) repeat protein
MIFCWRGEPVIIDKRVQGDHDILNHPGLCGLVHRGDLTRYRAGGDLLADRLEEASSLAACKFDIVQTYKEHGHEAYALRLLGELAMHRGSRETEQAEAYYQQALALAEELGMRPLVAHCYRGLGTLCVKTGQREVARAALSTAMEMYRTMEMRFWLPQVEAVLAQVERQ